MSAAEEEKKKKKRKEERRGKEWKESGGRHGVAGVGGALGLCSWVPAWRELRAGRRALGCRQHRNEGEKERQDGERGVNEGRLVCGSAAIGGAGVRVAMH